MKTLGYITKVLLFLGVVFLSLKTNAQISVPTQPIPSQRWNQWTKIQGYLTVDSALLTQFRDSTFKPKPGYYGFTLRNSGDTIVFFFNGIKWLPLITSVDLFKRNDSIFLRTNGTTKFVYKDSIGSGGSGGGLTSVSHDLTLLGQGTLANVLRVDTSIMATMHKLRDSMALIRTLIPQLTAGTNIAITGTFPNLTISATGGSGGGDIDSAATVGSGVPVFKEKAGPLLIFHNIGKDTTMNVVLAGDSIRLGVNLNVVAGKYYVDTAKQNIRNLIPNISAGTDISITGSFPNVVINNTGTAPIDTVSSINAMQNYNGTAKIIYVKDNYSGGLFYHTPTTPTADSGIVLNAYAKGGRFIRQWDQTFIVLTWFGIRPDSSADFNSTRLRYFTSWLRARGGGNVYIPEGTFIFKRGGNPAQIFLVGSNTKYLGAGIDKTILQLAVEDTFNFRRMFQFNAGSANVENFEIGNMTINMGNIYTTYPPPGTYGTDAQSNGIFTYSDNFKVRNGWFHDLKVVEITGDAIAISKNSENIVVERIQQRDYLRQGTGVGGEGGVNGIYFRQIMDLPNETGVVKGGHSFHIEPAAAVYNVDLKESIIEDFTGSGSDGFTVEDVKTTGTTDLLMNNVRNLKINRLEAPNQLLQIAMSGDNALISNSRVKKLYFTTLASPGINNPKNVAAENVTAINNGSDINLDHGVHVNNVKGVRLNRIYAESQNGHGIYLINNDSSTVTNSTGITRGATRYGMYSANISGSFGIGKSYFNNLSLSSPYRALGVANQSIVLGESNNFDAPEKVFLSVAKVFPYINPSGKRVLHIQSTSVPTFGQWSIGDEVVTTNSGVGSYHKYIASNNGYAVKDTGWNAGNTYIINDFVKGSNDSIYRAKSSGGQAENPITDTDTTYWVSVKSKTKVTWRSVGIIGLQYYGAGDPNGVVSAPVGAIYHRSNPTSINNTIYAKISGSENTSTVWAALIGTAAGAVALDTIYRKTGTDSVFYVKGGITYFAFRDSIGAGGGGSIIEPNNQVVVGTGSGVDSYSSFTYTSTDSTLRTKRFIGDSYGLGNDSGTVRGLSYVAGNMRIRANSITFATESGGTNILNLTSTGRLGLSTITAPTAVLDIPAGTTTRAPLRIRVGVAPTSPNAGDLYVKADGILYYYDGTTEYDLTEVGTSGTTGITALTTDVIASGTGTVVATIANNAVTDAKFRQSAGLSVVGRSASSTGNTADIIAASDYQVLRRSGTSIGFGALALNQANAVTGALRTVNGGTGLTSIGVAGQYLRVNLAANGLEWYTEPTSNLYFRNSGTTGVGLYVKQNDSTGYWKKIIAGTNVVINEADSNITVSVPTIPWSSVTGTPTVPISSEGIYSATTSSLGNLTTAQATDLNWYRTGNNITIYGNILVNVGDINEPTDFEMTIPPAVTQTFNSTDKQVGGGATVFSAVINETSAVHMTAVPSSNRIQFRWNSKATGNQNISFSVTYKLASLD